MFWRNFGDRAPPPAAFWGWAAPTSVLVILSFGHVCTSKWCLGTILRILRFGALNHGFLTIGVGYDTATAHTLKILNSSGRRPKSRECS